MVVLWKKTLMIEAAFENCGEMTASHAASRECHPLWLFLDNGQRAEKAALPSYRSLSLLVSIHLLNNLATTYRSYHHGALTHVSSAIVLFRPYPQAT